MRTTGWPEEVFCGISEALKEKSQSYMAGLPLEWKNLGVFCLFLNSQENLRVQNNNFQSQQLIG